MVELGGTTATVISAAVGYDALQISCKDLSIFSGDTISPSPMQISSNLLAPWPPPYRSLSPERARLSVSNFIFEYRIIRYIYMCFESSEYIEFIKNFVTNDWCSFSPSFSDGRVFSLVTRRSRNIFQGFFRSLKNFRRIRLLISRQKGDMEIRGNEINGFR